ncbi:hypothetical protein pb186bvf_004336 [Paramecium bursaria]
MNNRKSQSQQKEDKTVTKQKVESFIQENQTLTTKQLIKKAADEKKQKTPLPPKSNPKQDQKEKEKPIQKQIQQSEAIENQEQQYDELRQKLEKQHNLKLKEKSKECNQLQDKIKIMEQTISNLNNQVLEYKKLIELKIQSQIPYFEKRYLQMAYIILKKQHSINNMTVLVQQTRSIQFELENQLNQIIQIIEGDSPNLMKVKNNCQQLLERLMYVQSQQLNQNQLQFEKKQPKENINEIFHQLDQSVANIIGTLDKNKQQYNFIDYELLSQLENLSLRLQQFIITANIQPMKLKPLLIIVEEQYKRIHGQFSQLFPHFNSIQEIVKKQIQNDVIYQQMESVDEQIKQIEITPISLRMINILRSLLVHSLLCLYTYNLKPHFQQFQEIIKPFLEDLLQVGDQYYNNNEQIGQNVVWTTLKARHDDIKQSLEKTKQEIQDCISEYKGFWSKKIL